MNVSLQDVLDFRKGWVRQRLQISLDRILTLDWRKEIPAANHAFHQAGSFGSRRVRLPKCEGSILDAIVRRLAGP